eukprot:TRINITY_DN61590_c0_g1_i1.p1 TRINITY_DN61590_c0_g1~~TRINITY_DN61590_c0_g1_i1.p1  ORF type:complete len:1377 (+),score=198.70 TRINITY_DN61590_c0_g1_i1:50-4132(+)
MAAIRRDVAEANGGASEALFPRPLDKPSELHLLRLMLLKHFRVAWKKRRLNGMLLQNCFYSGILCVGYRLLAAAFPSPASENEMLGKLVALLAPVYIVLGCTTNLQLVVVDLVLEKQTKLRVLQDLSCLPARVYWLSWKIYFMLCAVMLTLVSMCFIMGASHVFGRNSDPVLVGGLFLLTYAQLFTVAGCISVVFNSAEAAGRVTALFAIFAVGGAAALQGYFHGSVSWISFVVSLLPVTSSYAAFSSALWLESGGSGLRFDTLTVRCCLPGQSAPEGNFFPTGMSIIMLQLSVVLYAFLCCWLDQVWQGEYGAAKPLTFCIRPQYVCPRRGAAARGSSASIAGNTAAISIQNLIKEFGGKRVVDGLDLNVRSGEILCLLGHNGAGKTTTINCLVGLIPLTSGAAFVNAFSVEHEVEQVRRQVGYCPQDCPIWDEFTVSEHVRFFSTLRGRGEGTALPGCIPEVLRQLGLGTKEHCVGKTLSGGQRRRLWVATAIVADTPILLLDEPTSGLDPSARRDLWKFLFDVRKIGRTIVFSTHYLEEADAMADKVAILSQGRVKAMGPPHELKRLCGAGYHLKIEFSKDRASMDGSFEEVQKLVERHVPSKTDVPYGQGGEVGVAFRLPVGEMDAFGPLFTDLSRLQTELFVSDCLLRMTSLEDVFLKLGFNAEDAEGSSFPADASEAASTVTAAGSGFFRSKALGVEVVDMEAAEADVQARTELSFKRQAWSVFRMRWQGLLADWKAASVQVVISLALLHFSTRDLTELNTNIGCTATICQALLAVRAATTQIEERLKKCDFVAFSHNLDQTAFWIGTLVVDYCVMLMVAVPTSAYLASCHVADDLPGYVPLLAAECIVYPLALLGFSYLLSFRLESVESLSKFFLLWTFIAAIMPAVALTVIQSLFVGSVGTFATRSAHIALSVLNPVYGLPGTVQQLSRLSLPDQEGWVSYFASAAALPLFCSPLHLAGLFWLVRRRGCVGRAGVGDLLQSEENGTLATFGDEDVLAEESRLQNVDVVGADAIVFRDIHFTYPRLIGENPEPVRAVRGISLGLRDGERFGLLGPNGAGKTTTLGILTGELWPPTRGQVLVDGHPVRIAADFSTLYQQLGHCPQVDPLWHRLTGREHLLFHGRIKGVPDDILITEVEDLLTRLGLASSVDLAKPVKQYSGGMMRKLSVGIALVGRPRVLFLDEPTAAVDVAGKRHMWGVIRSRCSSQLTVLTTHSMEEAEALCTRLAIQVLGRLRCLGSPAHVQSLYGRGFEMEVLADRRRDGFQAEEVVHFVRERISRDVVVVAPREGDRYRFVFQLPPQPGGESKMIELSRIFTEMSSARGSLGISMYSVWQPSLEQVFLRFAQEQGQNIP